MDKDSIKKYTRDIKAKRETKDTKDTMEKYSHASVCIWNMDNEA